MMNRWFVRASVLVGLASSSATALSAPRLEFKIDGTHSSVVFKVLNRDVSFVFGRFNDIEGSFYVDTFKDPKELEVRATVKAKGIDTNDKGRDKDLRKSNFFDVKKHKEISFTTTSSKQLEDGKFELTGDLTLLGQTHPITVLFEFTGSARMSGGKLLVGGITTFTLQRSQWGMTHALKGIADEVTITVSLQARRDLPRAG